MKKTSTQALVLTAVFAALSCAATLLVQIPIPATGGYANLGDGVILLSMSLLSPVQAALAAGIGTMLSDVLLGYMVYAPATLVIKGLMALLGGWLLKKTRPILPPTARRLAAALLAEAVMVVGYALYEGVFLRMGAGALTGVMGNVGQAAVAIVVFMVAAPLLGILKRK